jgi:hypothetical protein
LRNIEHVAEHSQFSVTTGVDNTEQHLDVMKADADGKRPLAGSAAAVGLGAEIP